MLKGLKAKIILSGHLILKTGMHIGSSSDYGAIGAVDSVVVRDVLTKVPIIPGSSIKGKLRYLLSRILCENGQLPEVEAEAIEIKRLFGSTAEPITLSRLQFSDLPLTKESVEFLQQADTDLYLTEIKFENTINRLTAIANPRQIERVPSGAAFDFELIYNVECVEELEEDMHNLFNAMTLLENDYLGGHGTRGYGRVAFADCSYNMMNYQITNEEKIQIQQMMERYFKVKTEELA